MKLNRNDSQGKNSIKLLRSTAVVNIIQVASQSLTYWPLTWLAFQTHFDY